MFNKIRRNAALKGGLILLLLSSSSLFASTDSLQPTATHSYIIVPADSVVSDVKNSAEPGKTIQSFAIEFAQSHEAKLITTYSTGFVGFVLETDLETAQRMSTDSRITHVHPLDPK